MRVTINGTSEEVPEALTVNGLLAHSGRDPAAVAVAVNLEFVSRNDYATTIVQENDDIEIVSPQQGG